MAEAREGCVRTAEAGRDTALPGLSDAQKRGDLDPLILDLLEWVAREPRSHAEVLDAWRTSCPRLTVWEDCLERGLLRRDYDSERGASVFVTPAGARFLRAHGRIARAHNANSSRAGRAVSRRLAAE